MIVAKGFLKLPDLQMLLKQKSRSFPRNLLLRTFDELLILKVNLLYLSYWAEQSCCLLHMIKQNYLLKVFLGTQILMTVVSHYLFSLLELHNISIIPKMVKKVITNLDPSKASGPDCIPVVILKNSELELLYLLAELITMCQKESCLPDFWDVSLVVPVN